MFYSKLCPLGELLFITILQDHLITKWGYKSVAVCFQLVLVYHADH